MEVDEDHPLHHTEEDHLEGEEMIRTIMKTMMMMMKEDLQEEEMGDLRIGLRILRSQ